MIDKKVWGRGIWVGISGVGMKYEDVLYYT